MDEDLWCAHFSLAPFPHPEPDLATRDRHVLPWLLRPALGWELICGPQIQSLCFCPLAMRAVEKHVDPGAAWTKIRGQNLKVLMWHKLGTPGPTVYRDSHRCFSGPCSGMPAFHWVVRCLFRPLNLSQPYDLLWSIECGRRDVLDFWAQTCRDLVDSFWAMWETGWVFLN